MPGADSEETDGVWQKRLRRDEPSAACEARETSLYDLDSDSSERMDTECHSYQLDLAHSVLTSSTTYSSRRTTDHGVDTEMPVATEDVQPEMPVAAANVQADMPVATADVQTEMPVAAEYIQPEMPVATANVQPETPVATEAVLPVERGLYAAWGHLNGDVLQAVFQGLRCQDAITASGVCKHWRAVAVQVPIFCHAACMLTAVCCMSPSYLSRTHASCARSPRQPRTTSAPLWFVLYRTIVNASICPVPFGVKHIDLSPKSHQKGRTVQ